MNRSVKEQEGGPRRVLRILIENGSQEFHNVGDAAMLAEAYRCVRAEWPSAEIHVTTRQPKQLQHFCPGCIPFNLDGRRALSIAWAPWRRLETRAPVLAPTLRRVRLMHRNPLNRIWIRLVCRYLRQRPADVVRFLSMLRSVDFLIYTGGGYFNDEFRAYMHELVSVGEVIQHLGKPVVAFGQGIGPLSTALAARPVEELLRKAAAVGTREDISFRWLEARRNPQTLSASTGDDVLLDPDLPLPPPLGSRLGVNVRLSHYSGIMAAELGFLRLAVANFLQEKNLPAVQSIPIKDTDQESTRLVLGSLPLQECPAEKRTVLERIAACRVLVTGSYHAAVFAYALGVTVIGVAANAYYLQKLKGVAERFRTPPLIFTPSRSAGVEHDAADLGRLLHTAWKAAPEIRAHLLEARLEQASTNRAFKRAVFNLVNALLTQTRASR